MSVRVLMLPYITNTSTTHNLCRTSLTYEQRGKILRIAIILCECVFIVVMEQNDELQSVLRQIFTSCLHQRHCEEKNNAITTKLLFGVLILMLNAYGKKAIDG